MRVISTLLLLLAIFFVVRSETTTAKLTRYCTSANCTQDAKPEIVVSLDTCESYTDPCSSLGGKVQVSAFEDDKTKFNVNLYLGTDCSGKPTITTNVTCGQCTELPNNGYYNVECPAVVESSEKSSENSSASTVFASVTLLVGLVIAALL